MLRIGLTAIALFLAASASVAAETVSRSVQEEFIQERRLASAVLTPHERRMIRRKERQIAELQQRARRDGVVTRSERREISRVQRQLNSYIQRARVS